LQGGDTFHISMHPVTSKHIIADAWLTVQSYILALSAEVVESPSPRGI